MTLSEYIEGLKGKKIDVIGIGAVSYTHLDVYKRQVLTPIWYIRA